MTEWTRDMVEERITEAADDLKRMPGLPIGQLPARTFLDIGCNAMDGAQPSGLREFVRARGYHSLYFLRVQSDDPIKIGITRDPASRRSGIQNANWRRVSFDRLWWLPGQPIAARIEAALKLRHLPSTSVANGTASIPPRLPSSWRRPSSGSAPGG